MLKQGLVEITRPSPGEYAYRITAEGRAHSFADLKEHLECLFETHFVEAEFDEMKLEHALEHQGVFAFGRKS